MQALTHELGRLRLALARRTGARRGLQWHVALLAVACALAFVHRIVTPLPVLSALDDGWLPALLAGLVLLAVGLLLERIGTLGAMPGAKRLARRLDDVHGWHDDTSTAVDLEADGESDVGAFLSAQAAGRLKEVASAVAPKPFRLRYLRIALAILFVFALIAPGITPWIEDTGPGGRTRDGIGPSGGEVGAHPLDADWFLMTFVEDPLPVEALPEDDPPSDGAEDDR